MELRCRKRGVIARDEKVVARGYHRPLWERVLDFLFLENYPSFVLFVAVAYGLCMSYFTGGFE